MGFGDDDFDNVLKEYPMKPGKRNATLYKLAGNSIVVNVLEAIFDVLLNEQHDEPFFAFEPHEQLQLV